MWLVILYSCSLSLFLIDICSIFFSDSGFLLTLDMGKSRGFTTSFDNLFEGLGKSESLAAHLLWSVFTNYFVFVQEHILIGLFFVIYITIVVPA